MFYREAAATRTVALKPGVFGPLPCSRQRILPYSTKGQLQKTEQGGEEQSMKI